MKKSELKITKEENRVTIKKKVDILYCAVYVLVYIVVLALIVLFVEKEKYAFFAALIVFGILVNGSYLLLLFAGKIVVDLDKREIHIYNMNRESYGFDEIKELQSFFREGDSDGGEDVNKLYFVFNNGHRVEFRTAGKNQTKELKAVLMKYLFSDSED